MEEEKIIFCKSGGCTAKLGAGVLEHILEKLPKGEKDPNLLVGYDSKDDASVYRLTDDLAMVQTLDFFPPVVEDPYTFGKIAAANALSDIYAMGGEVRTALNIVCFPEQMDLNVLGEIMRGGAEKVQEAGGSLSGGHSIADDSVKYGLSVTGTVHPDRIWQNNTGRVGDLLILTKPLGTGILCAAHRVGEENPGGFQKAVESMMTLNKYASETARKYNIHACTDVTGFSFLGHLHEMMESGVSCHIWADQIPVFPGAVEAAEEFLITAAGQRNRNHLEQHVTFKDIPFGMQEVLFDPQTSGGLLMAVDAVDAEKMQRKLLEQGIPAAIVGKITEPAETEEKTVCLVPAAKKTKLVVLSADHMGEGAEELGKILMKSFLYALTQQDELPDTILCYNGGAKLTCEGSESLEDLKDLAARGVEILTCGTCLNFYGITEKLQIGSVTNMYDIVERMSSADRVIKP